MNDEPVASTDNAPPSPLKAIQRRILGVLIEKARTTPDSYPLSLNGLVTGCNQKSNRAPVMSLSSEEVEDALIAMREAGLVAEVHGGGRVPKYRHFGYDYMGVKGVEAAVMTELLLRGEQTAGELRSRASRFEAIADLATLQVILVELQRKQLVVPLTPAGRGQLFTHGLYEPHELEYLRKRVGSANNSPPTAAAPASAPPAPAIHSASEVTASPTTETAALEASVDELKQEISDLKLLVAQLEDRLSKLES